MGFGTLLERAFNFGANALAARLAGPAGFGAYSLALSTASTASTYLGAGIGSTALRFGGEYPPEHPGHRYYLRSLAIMSAVSSLLAVSVLALSAGTLANIFEQPGVGGLLRLAGVSAVALTLMECVRNLYIGQGAWRVLWLLSILGGVGALALLPLAASWGPGWMLAAQSLASLIAVCGSLMVWRTMRPKSTAPVSVPGGLTATLRKLWTFGLVQLMGGIGLNIAGWWAVTLTARADQTLAEVAMLTIAFQLRNLVGIVPGILGMASYPLLVEGAAEDFGGGDRVTGVSMWVATLLGLIVATGVIVLLPLILSFYGAAYSGAQLAAAIAVATGLVHMANSPVASRLSIVSIRRTAMVNVQWTITTAGIATLLVPLWGAAGALTAHFLAHVASALMTTALHRKRGLLTAAGGCFWVSTFAAASLIGLVWWRTQHPGPDVYFAPLVLAVGCVFALVLWKLGDSQGWLSKS